MKKLQHVIISCLVIVVAGVYFYQHRGELVIFKNIGAADIFILGTLQFLFFVVTGYTFKFLVQLLGVRLMPQETIALSLITNFGNYLGPTSPGSVMKAVYLKSAKGLEYSKFTSVFVMNNFLGFGATGLLGFGLYFFLKAQYAAVPVGILAYSIFLVAGVALVLSWKMPAFQRQGKLGAIVRSAYQGFQMLRAQPARLAWICFSYVPQFVLRGVIFYYAFAALGLPITLLLAAAMAVYSSMFDFYLTPNNLGIQEGLTGYLFLLGGFDFSQGVVAAALVRAVHFVMTMGLAPVFIHFLLRSQNLSWQSLQRSAL